MSEIGSIYELEEELRFKASEPFNDEFAKKALKVVLLIQREAEGVEAIPLQLKPMMAKTLAKIRTEYNMDFAWISK